MKMIYIDYENVQSAGLNGIEMLTRSDKVFLFYSIHAETMKMYTVQNLISTPAVVQFIKAETGTANALDFQLVASIFLKIKKGIEYVIVSKDTGFDPIVHMGMTEGYQIKRVPSISAMFEESPQLMIEPKVIETKDIDSKILKPKVTPRIQIEAIIVEKCGTKIADKYSDLIIEGLKKSKNKNQFYQFFRKKLGDSKGVELYRSVRGKFEEMKAILKSV